MYKTLSAIALTIALCGPALAHETGKPHEHPHGLAVETLINAVDAVAACEGGISLDDLREAALMAEENILVLEGTTLDAFASAVKAKYDVDKPADIVKLVIPNFFSSDPTAPVMIAHIDANDCFTGQSMWEREFMNSAFQEADFVKKD